MKSHDEWFAEFSRVGIRIIDVERAMGHRVAKAYLQWVKINRKWGNL